MEEVKIKEYYEKNPEGIEPIPEIPEIYEMHQLIRNSLSKIAPYKLLDAGCGKGFTGKSVIEYCKEYHGMDLSSTAINFAKKRIPEGKFKVGTIREISYGNGEFDCILCSEVLEHVPEYKTAIKEMTRVLKSKGFLIITTPNKYNPDMALKLFTQGKYTSQIYDSPIDYNELFIDFKNNGLEIINFFSFWFFPSLGNLMNAPELQKHMKYLQQLSFKTGKPLGLYLFFVLQKI